MNNILKKSALLIRCLLTVSLLSGGQCLAADTEKQQGEPLIIQLAQSRLSQLNPVLEAMYQQWGNACLPLFDTLLAGKLYFRKTDFSLLEVHSTADGFSARTVSLHSPAVNAGVTKMLNTKTLNTAMMHDNPSGSTPFFLISPDAIAVDKKTVKKIKINNKVRRRLKRLIATIHLQHEDAGLRLAAVSTLTKKMDHTVVQQLTQQLQHETDETVIESVRQSLSIYQLEPHHSRAIRLRAIAELQGSLEPRVKNALERLLVKDEQHQFVEQDSAVREQAQTLLSRMQSRIAFYGVVEQVFFGLSLGSVLLLAAIGLAITFGVMGVINMAHGEMIMLGAYTTYTIQILMPQWITWSLWLAIPAAFLVSALVGILIERTVIRFLHGRPLETLLATFGVSLILQQTVRTLFSPLNRQVVTPEWMLGSITVNPALSLTLNRLYILLFSLIVFSLLYLVMKKTRLGLQVRAVSQNRPMADALGVRTQWVDALTFGLGSGIAGVAGVALSQLTNVGPNLGQAYIIDSFLVVVFGGVGNLFGTLAGSFSLGIANKFFESFAGAVVAKIIILVSIVLFIQRRPKGIFPQRGRAADE